MTPVFYELNSAVVGIAGLGGLGSNVAEALVRMKVGKLILVDFDRVEIGNLNRQKYFHDQIGQWKVHATIENLKRIWPQANLEGHNLRLTPELVQSLFASADVIAECFDRADQKQMIVETVLTKMPDKVIVSVSGLAGWGASNEIQTRHINNRLVLVGDGVSGTGPGIPLTAARVGVAAYHQANAIIEALMDLKLRSSPGGAQ